MKKLLKLSFLAIMVLGLFTTSCEDDESTSTSELTITIKSDAQKFKDLKEAGIQIKNVNTGAIKDVEFNGKLDAPIKVTINQGIYTISATCKATYFFKKTKDDKEFTEKEVKLGGIVEEMIVNETTSSATISMYSSAGNLESNFVISEIHYTGSLTEKDQIYRGDSYFEIYNNSNKTLYADGLSIGVSKFLTTDQSSFGYWVCTPDFVNEAISVSSIFTIPGDGDDYPIKPGEAFIIADVAINHKTKNSKSFDLSKAKFEWYEKDEAGQDVDVQEVQNMLITYTASNSVTSLHGAGTQGYFLFRMDKEAEAFLNANNKKYNRQFFMNGELFGKPQEQEGYFIPNEMIIDGVQGAIPDDYSYRIVDFSIDLGYAYCIDEEGKTNSKVGKVIKRKVAKKDGDRIILMDTNNSKEDFLHSAIASPGSVEQN